MNNTAYVAALLSIVVTGSAGATQWTATAGTIQLVMTEVGGGDTVKLVGDFGVTRLTNKSYASPVTIDASAATFSDGLVLTGVSNVNVVGGRFGSDASTKADNKAVFVSGGANVAFTNPNVAGFYTGVGIAFQGTTNAWVTGATLSRLRAGIVFAGVNGGSISNSKSIGSVGDGIDLIDSNHVDVGHNSCTGSTPLAGAHPDCVQLFSSAGAKALSYINIHDNFASGETQGFDNFGSVAGDRFISIVNNRVAGLFSHGIACNYCINSTITGNILTSLDGAPHQVTMSVLFGTNNIVSGNSVGKVNQAAAKDIVYYSRAELAGGAVLLPTAPGAAPEPYAWTMLIAGFGMIGFSQRARRYVLGF